MSKLNTSKANGPDGISNRVLRECADFYKTQGVQSETLVKKLGFQTCFWVSRKPGNSVISHPVK